MDEEETKVCPNCKREIPGVNFTTHTVHCARNIRVCPVCKEPVPLADLQRHHDELHKQLPCKQCGESVCGTDLEDHIRDSCAHTIKSCRFCELELPRGELPAHEGYCGVRTEQCPECREWVMIKYRQLHLDSNHGFIRLHDDPAPIPKKDPYKINLNRPTTFKNQPSTSNGYVPASLFDNFTREPNRLDRPERKVTNNNDGSSSGGSGSSLSEGSSGRSTGDSSVSSAGSSNSSGLGLRDNRRNQSANGVKPPLKRTNDQPQININSASTNKVDKDLGVSRGAVKKRVAPKPPPPPPANPARDLPYYSAVQRKQKEDKQREEQNAYNLSVGLPPVLSPAAKVEKLRKMDALQNREVANNDYKNRLRKDIWKSGPSREPGHILGAGPSRPTAEPSGEVIPGPSNMRNRENGELRNASNAAPLRVNINGPLKNINNQSNDEDVDMQWQDFKNLKPMTPEEFMARFNELQLRKDGQDDRQVNQRADRFSEIKSSLRELRRGLNEVTAPYNANNAAANNVNNGRANRRSGSVSPRDRVQNMQDVPDVQDVQDMQDVRLPCEFCGIAVPMDDLVQHQTGCRPDLAQFRVDVMTVDNARSPALNHNRHQPLHHQPLHHQPLHQQPQQPVQHPQQRDNGDHDDPVIPCEFCARSLPVYLISEHQERCGRESNLLFAD